MGNFLSILLAGVISHGVCSDAFAQVVVKKDQLSPFSWETPLGPKVGLVLSGGGARGIFQIGVIKALEEHDVPIHFIVGTSMGSIVGGLYAAGYSVPDLERLAKTLNWQELLALEGDIARSNVFLSQKKLYDRTLISLELDGWKPRIPLAVSTGQKLTTKLNELTLQGIYHPNPSFDQLKFPFRSVATNLATGKKFI
ncbi:MAG: patatin-like phospholipase family protein, partial [Bacteroidetes bacterium]|nr:patatin-like phospholipase family protein [Bacteroidota bacterium]